MARETMAVLITRLRRMIGDPAGTSAVWSDDDLQDALDGHRREARYARLREIETIASGGGSVSYLSYAADVGNWENTVTLSNGSFTTLTSGITADLKTGRWTFSAEPNRPVYITGFYYDLAGAAAEILDAWIAMEKAAFDFSTDGQSFKRSQKVEHLESLATKYRAQMWIESGAIISTDFNPNPWM